MIALSKECCSRTCIAWRGKTLHVPVFVVFFTCTVSHFEAASAPFSSLPSEERKPFDCVHLIGISNKSVYLNTIQE